MRVGPSPWDTVPQAAPHAHAEQHPPPEPYSPTGPPHPRRPPDEPPGGRDLGSDAHLLARCRTGDGAAWQELLYRYQRLVFGIALRDGLDVEDAADVTQTTFVALLDSITQLRSDERLSAWLTTVARRTAWRTRRRREQEIGVAEPPVPADECDWDQVAALHEGLGRLAAPCRDLLAALYFDPTEPSYAEIAHRLGRAIGGIGPMRARCLQRLRTLIDDGERR